MDESKSDAGDDEEEIITNSMYVILDIQEVYFSLNLSMNQID